MYVCVCVCVCVCICVCVWRPTIENALLSRERTRAIGKA